MRLVNLMAAALLLLPNLATAQIDGCDELIKVDQENDALSWALGGLEQLFMADEEVVELSPIGDAEFWVTIQPGRFANITCEEKQFEDQEMYPIGLVVKPLGVLDLPAYTGAERGTPVLALTEYGHRKIISIDDIAPITPNATYIFADGVSEATFCYSTSNCPSNQPTECKSAIWRCSYKIGAVSGYAVVPSLNEDVASIIDAFEKLTRDPILQLNHGRYSPDRIAELEAEACRPFSARAYKPGAVLHQRGAVALSLCAREGRGVLPLKVVDTNRATARFSHGLTVSFHRELGSPTSMLSESVRALANKRLVFAKNCGEEIEAEQIFSLGGSAGIDANFFGVASVELGANRKASTSYIEKVGLDEYLLYTTYFIRPIPKPADNAEENDLWVFDILFRAGCEGGEPRERSSVVIFYKDLPLGYVPIGVKEGIFTNYVANWGPASFAEGTSPAQIYQGHFWVIKDHLAYFRWRDNLRQLLYEDIGVARDLIQRYPPEQQPLVRDFMVYLFLSAAFDHRRPIRYLEE